MYNIDTNTAVGSMPTPQSASTAGWFSQSSPFTVTSADWANGIQAELLNILSEAGITPSKATTNQVLTALRSLFRIKLTESLNLYVATTGSDTANTGLTSGSPFATLQHAWNVLVTQYDLNGNNVTINVANGTYTQSVNCGGLLLGQNIATGSVTFLGNTSSPSSVIISASDSACFGTVCGAFISVAGFTLEASGGGGNYLQGGMGLFAGQSAVLGFQNIIFGACNSAHISATNGGEILSNGNSYSITGGAVYHCSAAFGGNIVTVGSAVTLTGTPAFTVFASASGGTISAWSMTFTGAATGQRYNAQVGGSINTQGGGANYFPGNSAGVSTTGYYE